MCSLSSLPREVLGLIFEEIEDYIDLVLFAFSCKYLLAVGYPHMHRKRRQNFAPWAGDAIICLGDYATALPEKEEIPKTVADEFMEAFNGDAGLDVPHRSHRPSWYRIVNDFSHGADLHWTLALHHWLNRPFVDNSLGWTLRNLSTRQYVRDDAINIDVPKIRIRIGLAQAVTFRCGWSQVDLTSTPAEGLHEGRWAGDRLDIVPYDKDAEWAKEWEDVSLEVERDIRKGYIAEGHLDEESDEVLQ